ncbi:MAG: hypothetical protein QOJ97_108 [Solirubrobacteraceae bacterium]|jgi:hypothetical protein|nr:hypothetical protein [Solirubrobacteraceae bacterium]
MTPGYTFDGIEVRHGSYLVATFILDFGEGRTRRIAVVPDRAPRLRVAMHEDEAPSGFPDLDAELASVAAEWLAAIRSVPVVASFDNPLRRRRHEAA